MSIVQGRTPHDPLSACYRNASSPVNLDFNTTDAYAMVVTGGPGCFMPRLEVNISGALAFGGFADAIPLYRERFLHLKSPPFTAAKSHLAAHKRCTKNLGAPFGLH